MKLRKTINQKSKINNITLAGLILVTGCLAIANQSIASNKKDPSLPSNADCTKSALTQSRCIIDTILNDVVETYPLTDGGGISSIKQDSTWTYTVSISQEERVDLITYTVKITAEGKVAITHRKTGTKTPRH